MDKKVISAIISKAFTTENEQGGNEAGIVFNERLDDYQMQFAAKKLGFSETVFIEKREDNNFQFRFFTPFSEVPVCGHATIAATAYLAENKLSVFPVEIVSKAGKLKLFPEHDTFFMELPLPIFGNSVEPHEIADSLQTDYHNLFLSNLQPMILATGLPDLIIPVVSPEILQDIAPNYEMIKKMSRKYNLVGFHLFALLHDNIATASCRNFAPLYGINEESATGTANGALACYLFQNGVKKKEYLFKQGIGMGKPSQVVVNIGHKNEKIVRVKVGGKVVEIGRKCIEIHK
jgi:PhzF family phenazine biosynthesis protein